ncbi:hypothetical protein EVAR_11543_1 [Eumeta japonica]|uniref:Uncharacterized protein n=1 Tax=Eumeta variegata TaxID=151549 RepID=A0A4C1TZ03_EUMVA|nr:hypothetical protein EVAR_11543_1 [Eumeta japonica]
MKGKINYGRSEFGKWEGILLLLCRGVYTSMIFFHYLAPGRVGAAKDRRHQREDNNREHKLNVLPVTRCDRFDLVQSKNSLIDPSQSELNSGTVRFRYDAPNC